MSLWDIIRDFIVQYITGGHDSEGVLFSNRIGIGIYGSDGSDEVLDTASTFVPINLSMSGAPNDPITFISFGDWLATTLTIIAMCLLVAFAIWLVRWIFKSVTSAFLLRR